MQSKNPFIDEVSKLATAAMGLAQAAGEEAKAAVRAQVDKAATEYDLVRRDEFEALKAEVAALRLQLKTAKPNASQATRPGAKPVKKAPPAQEAG